MGTLDNSSPENALLASENEHCLHVGVTIQH